MDNFLSGMIVGFREGLEAFLLIVIMLCFLRKAGRDELIGKVRIGAGLGILLSLLAGGILFAVSSAVGKLEQTAKLWESGTSLLALLLITTFIIWMIRQGSSMVENVERDTSRNLYGNGIIMISATMIAREGVEIAIFSFAGEYVLPAIFLGILLALILTVAIYYSLVRVNLRTIFSITMLYLILQAGFLLGYGIHEGLSAFKEIGILSENSALFLKAFNLSGTILDHKTGIIGVPLYVLLGWYSKPEIIQFAVQYTYTAAMLWYYWYRTGSARELSAQQG